MSISSGKKANDVKQNSCGAKKNKVRLFFLVNLQPTTTRDFRHPFVAIHLSIPEIYNKATKNEQPLF